MQLGFLAGLTVATLSLFACGGGGGGTTPATGLVSTAAPSATAPASASATATPTAIATANPTAAPTASPTPPITINGAGSILTVGQTDAACVTTTISYCFPLGTTDISASQSNGFVGPFGTAIADPTIATATSSGQTISVTGHRAGTTSLQVNGFGGAAVTLPVGVTTISSATIHFTFATIPSATTWQVTGSQTCSNGPSQSGGPALLGRVFPSPLPATYTYTVYNMQASATEFNAFPYPLCYVSGFTVIVTNGIINLVNETIPVTVTPNVDNVLNVSVP